ncbi:RapGAP [Acrasis kona]|uniref:RapGAP n=1 Tax=Acrasis kona TaxID=1008807 RepID=A0AAW2ZKJ1_9EUKA
MFAGIRTRPSALDAKKEAALLDKDTPISKRFKYLSQLTVFYEEEGGIETDVRTFYQKNYSAVYTIFLDALNNLDAEAKKKVGKTIPNGDVLLLANILLTLFKYARNMISRKWQQRSLILYLESYLDENNVFIIKKKGVELLLNFVDIMQDNVDAKVFDMVMNIFNFQPFTTDLVLSNGSRVPDPTPVKLPSYPKRAPTEGEKLRLETGKNTTFTAEESYEVLVMFFDFVKTKTDQFDFWWKFFKSRLAPVLYPNECKSLELLNKLDDMGYTKHCPTTLHLLVLEMILMGLENPKKSESLYQTDKDIYLFLLIFRQSFLLPTNHYDSLTRMLKTYRSWICRDYFLYAWPDIMERSRNIYFRVFIDNLSQTFFMQGDEMAMDVHFTMCYEVLEIFLFFTNIPEKVEFDTWSDLLSTHMRIYNHLVQRKNSNDKYDQQFGTMLERTVIRNLFMIWLKCHPDDSAVDLWNQLYELLQKNFNMESVFTMWRSTLLNLTRTMIHVVFGLPEEYIIGEFLNYETELYDVVKKNKKNKITPRSHIYPQMKEHFQKLEQTVLLQQWHKMVKMYGFENVQNTPGALHTKKIRVLSEVITMFLDISQCEVKVMKGTQVPNFVHSPEANRLLEIFMGWLIEATSRHDEAFADGRYTAYVTLCRIFCNQKSSQPIQMIYLAHFYKSIYLGLDEANQEISNNGPPKNSRSMEAILLNSQKLFSYGYPGCNALIPHYVTSCQLVLRETSTSSRDLRIAAVHTLISVVTLTYYYGDLALPNLDNSDAEPNTYSQTKRTNL